MGQVLSGRILLASIVAALATASHAEPVQVAPTPSALAEAVGGIPEAPPITIKYSGAGASGWSDVPAGAYRVPNSSVIISGHQKGGGVGLIFGAVGVLAQSAVNSDVGKSAVGSAQDALQIDAAALATEVTQKVLESERFSRKLALATNADHPSLSVLPFVAITFVSDTEVRPYVVLKATLQAGTSGGATRTTRYFCCEGRPAPLTGDNSLTANNGEALKQLVASEMETAINVLFSDVVSPYPRNDGAMYFAEGNFPYMRNSIKVKGYNLGDYQDYSIFALKASSLITYAGVHIMDKSVVAYSAAPPSK
jgi:hypothetical protein